jgi:hypothetical protein
MTEMNDVRALPADRAFAAAPSSPAVSTVPASIPSAFVLEDLRNSAVVEIAREGNGGNWSSMMVRSGLMLNIIDDHKRLTGRVEELQAALDLALAWLTPFEPGDSRAVSDEFFAMAAIACEVSGDRANHLRIIVDAQAIEARRAATGTGAVYESAVPQACAPQGPSHD